MSDARPDIALLTLLTPEFRDFEASARNKQDYCAVHGYACVVGRESLDPSRHPAWSKLHLVRRHLPEHGWVFWSDADALVTNFSVRLESFLTDVDDGAADLLVTRDRNGLNNGHFLVRNTPAALAFLDAALARTDTLDHPWQEQEAVRRLLAERPDLLRVRYLPQRAFNAYPTEMLDAGDAGAWQPGDFVCHCPGEGKHLFPTLPGRCDVRVRERRELGNLFARLGYRGDGAEVGVAAGDFAQVLRATWATGRTLHLVDRWRHAAEGYRDRANVPPAEQDALHRLVCARFAVDAAAGRVRVVRAESVDAAATFADGSLDFVYLDADHAAPAVAADLAAWWPKVRRGGVLAGHDFVDDGERPGGEGVFGVKGQVTRFAAARDLSLYLTGEPDWPSWYAIKR